MGSIRVASKIQGRLRRSGKSRDDVCEPDHGTPCEPAAEPGLHSWAVEGAVTVSHGAFVPPRGSTTVRPTPDFDIEDDLFDGTSSPVSFQRRTLQMQRNPVNLYRRAADVGGRQFRSTSPPSGPGRPRRSSPCGPRSPAAAAQNVPYPGLGPAGFLAGSGVTVATLVAPYVLFRRRDRL